MDLESQTVKWVAALPHEPKQEVFSRAAPLQVGKWLVVTHTLLDQGTGGKLHRAVVLDLAEGRVSSQFPTLTFAAQVPAADGKSLINFDLIGSSHAQSAISARLESSGERM
jgi:hypothetical protein